MKNLWFSIVDETDYKGDEPAFYDFNNYVEWKKIILDNAEKIRNEFLKVADKKQLFEPYFNQGLSSVKNKWQTIGLKFWGINNYNHQKEFPVTTAIINQIPTLVSASFNKLEAGIEILPHNGDSNGFYRCHLGIIIDEGLPNMGFQVKSEKRAWQKDDLIVFCDANKHRAWNFANSDRYIFLFDIIREDALQQKNKIVGTILSSMFLQKIALKFNLDTAIKKRKKLKPLVSLLIPFALFSKWFVNYFKIY